MTLFVKREFGVLGFSLFALSALVSTPASAACVVLSGEFDRCVTTSSVPGAEVDTVISLAAQSAVDENGITIYQFKQAVADRSAPTNRSADFYMEMEFPADGKTYTDLIKQNGQEFIVETVPACDSTSALVSMSVRTNDSLKTIQYENSYRFFMQGSQLVMEDKFRASGNSGETVTTVCQPK